MTATLYDAIAYVVNEANKKALDTGIKRRIRVCRCGSATPHLRSGPVGDMPDSVYR